MEANNHISNTKNTSNNEANFEINAGYRVTLFSNEDNMISILIPAVPEGFYRFSNDAEYRCFWVEAKDGKWYVCCNTPAYFKNSGSGMYGEIQIKDGLIVEAERDDIRYYIFSEMLNPEHMRFVNYQVSSNDTVIVGSSESCDIRYNNVHCSSKHAVISFCENKWHITDLSNDFGVFVNGHYQSDYDLSLGDTVCVFGLQIIIGTKFLSVNNASGVSVSGRLTKYIEQRGGNSHYYYPTSENSAAETFFNRSPRKKLELPQKSIVIEPPPISMQRSQMPLMLRMGSSMVMGGMSALSGNFTTLLSSVMFPLITQKYTDKQKQEYEAKRLTKYTAYLEEKKQEIHNACIEEQVFLEQKYPSINGIVVHEDSIDRLWERRPMDSDFLTLRIGTGERRLSAAIEYPERGFELEYDELEEKMYELAEKPYILSNMPLTVSFAEDYVCGIVGNRCSVMEYVQQMVVQTAVFHSYDEVKLVFLGSQEDISLIDQIKFLPHVWDDRRAIRFIATEESEVYRIGEYIKGQITDDSRENQELSKTLKNRPYYIVFAFDKKLLEGHEIFKTILQNDNNMGVSIVSVYDNLPKECQKIISIGDDNKGRVTSLQRNGGDDTYFAVEKCRKEKLDKILRVIANTKLKNADQLQELPKSLPFLEMFGAGTVEQLNPLKRWSDNNPVKSLAAPVGVGVDGSLFTLDLHEKRQGPHGLVAGMTGSGKSEFLITYILSMAVNYHPDEVAFVLIDYKGGGLAGAFENPRTGVKLPHLVGTITNLDGASIQRSLLSIESELKRRQRLFSKVNSMTNEGTIDIYAYQKLYRAGKISKPLPHLFIVSDEFAELKQQQPEFMEKLISAARIGRSLGVHLILATQKPSGVVNDQIRSNTKFRVCLRVQDKSDSMDMLKRGEAAELTDTGRFYLQVGYNEYFALGQSAWCGADYEPAEVVKKKRDDSIQFLDTTGQAIANAKPKVKTVSTGKKQIVAIVEYLSKIANEQGIKSHGLWRPELPKALDLDELNIEYADYTKDSKYKMCLGMVDDPERQEQFPYVFDIADRQHCLISGTVGSGKTVLIQNILYYLAKNVEPQDCNFYILDYSSRMLKVFKKLPHCGAVLQDDDVDSLDEFFKLINSFVAERKKLFSELEVDNFETACSFTKLPLIVVVIDNIAGFLSTKPGEAHGYKLQNYLKESANYGITYIVTCNHFNEVQNRIRQEIGKRISLHMKDKYDCGEFLECKVNYVPNSNAGRGLINYEGRPLEVQHAVIKLGIDDTQRIGYLKDDFAKITSGCVFNVEARRMPVVSETATFEEFAGQFRRGRIPLGYSKQNGKPVALPLKQFSGLSIYFGNSLGTDQIINNIIFSAYRENMDAWIVKRSEKSVFDDIDSNYYAREERENLLFEMEEKSICELRTLLLKQVSERNSMIKEYCDENGLDRQAEDTRKKLFGFIRDNTIPVMVLIENMAEFCKFTDNVSSIIFDKCFSLAQSCNIYIVAGFEPDDNKAVENRLLYYGFNPNGNILLFGGQFNKQDICVLPETAGLDKLLQYNVGIMNYRNRFHPILMPCGEIVAAETDEDEQSIF